MEGPPNHRQFQAGLGADDEVGYGHVVDAEMFGSVSRMGVGVAGPDARRAVPPWDSTIPDSRSRPTRRRMTTGFVLTLPA